MSYSLWGSIEGPAADRVFTAADKQLTGVNSKSTGRNIAEKFVMMDGWSEANATSLMTQELANLLCYSIYS